MPIQDIDYTKLILPEELQLQESIWPEFSYIQQAWKILWRERFLHIKAGKQNGTSDTVNKGQNEAK